MNTQWNRAVARLGGLFIVAICTCLIGVHPEANAQDKALEKITVKNCRDMRFGEIFVVKKDGVIAYNTTGSNDCPPELWDALDVEKLAKEYGAERVQKNGPKFWVMDSQTLMFGEKASFGGLEARWAAKLPLAGLGKEGGVPYQIFNPKKTQRMVYLKDKPVYELVDPDGHAYVLQAHGPEFTLESLPKLGEKLKKLPKGWSFRTRVLTEDLVLDLKPDETIYAVGDEFHQYYTRIPESVKVTMTTGQGKKVTLSLKMLPNSRDYQYCELVFNYGEIGNDIYSTSPLAPADLKWWDSLDVEKLAKEFGAKSVYKNGPQWWSMDEVGVMVSEPVEVAGVKMNFGAHLPPGTVKIPKYTVFNPAKYQYLVWKAGKPVYELVDADGFVYVLQGHKIPTDQLATLGEKFQHLPKGWKYRVKVLDKDLVMNLTPKKPIPSVQDEFNQIYIRIPE